MKAPVGGKASYIDSPVKKTTDGWFYCRPIDQLRPVVPINLDALVELTTSQMVHLEIYCIIVYQGVSQQQCVVSGWCAEILNLFPF